jgi:hypothetical protein
MMDRPEGNQAVSAWILINVSLFVSLVYHFGNGKLVANQTFRQNPGRDGLVTFFIPVSELLQRLHHPIHHPAAGGDPAYLVIS